MSDSVALFEIWRDLLTDMIADEEDISTYEYI